MRDYLQALLYWICVLTIIGLGIFVLMKLDLSSDTLVTLIVALVIFVPPITMR